ncbi:riboflavin biosynthesis protein RibD C-terminal domain protein [Leptospira weilii serovar Ranarum str. ICFT]|uniref:Riboflavin biosynthesis protein RibD C-terminal domain protein n=1 Tax=Leptospira weilii serovar Ranarum str. ICFT TaxID=1218598 RepID=N1WA22_9LEPT|nr:dihydrofolate reductase family protein [Leptospira weilii]EMY77081.1 riboflavin biosynthesis protein RibD C-terminal domain protein [Leptospira weilii serovar Ranarum str. ICFT]
MRKIIFAINMTADGYCSHTDMIADEELHKYFTNLLRTAGLVLYGRITYQLMVPFWPEVAQNQSMSEVGNEFARVFDSLDKVLFSTTLKFVEGKNTRLVHGNMIEEALALKQQPGKDIFVGSLSIASQLSELHLIDEYRFVVHPVLAGKGPRLFDTVSMQKSLRLDFLGSETFQSGALALHYKKHT